jgi:hypothetical protein
MEKSQQKSGHKTNNEKREAITTRDTICPLNQLWKMPLEIVPNCNPVNDEGYVLEIQRNG